MHKRMCRLIFKNSGQGGLGMSEVIRAFIQYGIEYIVFIAVAVAGVFTGRKLLENKKKKNGTADVKSDK